MSAHYDHTKLARPATLHLAGAIPSEAYAIVAEFRAKPGMEDELREATQSLIGRAWSEPNTLLFFLNEDRETPGRFVFYEVYASQADFEAHKARPYVQAWFARLPELTDGDMKVMRMELLGPR